jgi:Tfp pilus assembly protein PilO
VRNRAVLLFVVAAVAIVALWWFFVYSPLGDDLDQAKDDTAAAEAQTASLRAQLQQLEDIEDRSTEIDAEIMRLDSLVPENPDLASFILAANEIALQSGIDWLSITPSPPQADPSGLGVINMQISIQGGFFQALDYLSRLENLQRLVIVDSIDTSAGGATEGGITTGSGPALSISLAARMFTDTVPAAPGAPTDDTTTTTVAGETTTTTAAGQAAGEVTP